MFTVMNMAAMSWCMRLPIRADIVTALLPGGFVLTITRPPSLLREPVFMQAKIICQAYYRQQSY